MHKGTALLSCYCYVTVIMGFYKDNRNFLHIYIILNASQLITVLQSKKGNNFNVTLLTLMCQNTN